MKLVRHKFAADGAAKLRGVSVNVEVPSGSGDKIIATAWGSPAVMSLLRNVSILTLAGVAGAAITLGQGIVVARWLQPELYGVAVLVMSYPSLMSGVLDARSGDVSVKYLSQAHIEKNRDRSLAISKFGYALDLLLALAVFTVVLFTAPWAALMFVKNAAVADLIVITAAALIPASLIRTSQATMTSLGRFDLLAWTDMLAKLVRAIAVLSLVFLGLKLEGIIWGNAIGLAISGFLYATVAWFLTYRLYGATPLSGRLRDLRGQRREMLRFLAYNDVTALIAVIPRELDVLALGYFRGAVEVGYLKLAKSFGSLTGYLAAPLQSVVYPELVKLWSGGRATAVMPLIREVMLKLALPIGVGSVVVVALVPLIVTQVVGASYQDAVFCCQLIFVASALSLIFFWIRPFFFMKSQYLNWLLASGGVTLLCAVIYPLMVIGLGHDGAAIWYLMLTVIGICAAMILMKVDP